MAISAVWLPAGRFDVEFVEVLPDLHFPHRARIVVSGERHLNVDVMMEVTFDETVDRYVIDSLVVKRRGAGSPAVDAAELRTLRLDDYVRRSNLSAVPFDGGRIGLKVDAKTMAAVRAGGPSDDDSLRWAARIYAWAHAFHLPPTQEVERRLKLSRPSASEWIRKARDRGFLGARVTDESSSSSGGPYTVSEAELEDAMMRTAEAAEKVQQELKKLTHGQIKAEQRGKA